MCLHVNVEMMSSKEKGIMESVIANNSFLWSKIETD